LKKFDCEGAGGDTRAPKVQLDFAVS